MHTCSKEKKNSLKKHALDQEKKKKLGSILGRVRVFLGEFFFSWTGFFLLIPSTVEVAFRLNICTYAFIFFRHDGIYNKNLYTLQLMLDNLNFAYFIN